MKLKIPALLLILLSAGHSFCQVLDSAPDTTCKDVLNVYFKVDLADFSMDYVKTEIPVIDYVRDPKDADVYIIATSQRTGTHSQEFAFYLIGQHGFTGMNDTIKYISSADDTKASILEGQVEALKKGLLPYIVRTSLRDRLEINFVKDPADESAKDSWNNWVFNLYAGADLRGERTSKYTNIWGGFSIEKITRDWKFELETDFGNQVEKFDLDEGKITSRNNARIGEAILVKSMGEHWGAGGQFFLGSFTFSNFKVKSYVFPGIEYNIFPYSESARKQIRIFYGAGFAGHLYNDTTIYYEVSEFLWGQKVDIAAKMIQKWGSLNVYLGWKNYLHDWSKNNLSFSGTMNLRIAKGLQVQLNAGVSIIHNQLSLVKGGATTEEILLRQVELETQYSYFSNLSLRYTFGSIYDRLVNARFDNVDRW